jgi:hypothetical protein
MATPGRAFIDEFGRGSQAYPIESGCLSGAAPYAEITLGYLTGNETFPLISDGNSPNSVKLSFDVWPALSRGGDRRSLGERLKVRPIVLGGFSHVGGDAQFYGLNSVLARAQVSGILSDASLNSVLLQRVRCSGPVL